MPFHRTSHLKSLLSFCPCVDQGRSTVPLCWHSNPALESAIINSNNVPKAAFFAVFVPRNTHLHRETQLRLCCMPTCKRCELNDHEEKLGNVLIGDGSSDIPMCSNEKAYVFLSEGIVAPLIAGRLQGLHVRLQEEPFLRNLPVRVDNQGVFTVSFCGRKERDEDNMLCELDVTLPPSIIVPDKKGGEGLRHTRDHLTEGTSPEPETTAGRVETRTWKRKNFTGHSSRVPPKRKKGIQTETAQLAESKPLKDLVNDPSNFLDKICEHLDALPEGLGNYEHVAKHYGYEVFTVESRFKRSPGGPSKALIVSIMTADPDVTVEGFAKVVKEQARREDVARLLREFDQK